MHRRVEVPTAADVFFDPVVQLAALCPICALAALRPEAAIAALAPTLFIFNPALNPEAALLSFALAPMGARRGRMYGGRSVRAGLRTDPSGVRSAHAGARSDAGGDGWDARITDRRGGGAVFRTAGAVARPDGDRWVFSTLKRA